MPIIRHFFKQLPTALILILIGSFFLYLYAIWWGLPSFTGWAADELTPAIVIKGIERSFSNGWRYKYPPFHFYLLTILYSPVLILNWLRILDIHSLPIQTLLFYMGRLLTVFMAISLIITVYLCGQEIYEKRAAIFTSLITALLLPFTYYSKMINLDIPYLFWFVLSLLFYVRILKYQNIKDYLLFSATAAIAVCTKDQAYGFYLLTPIFILWQHHLYLKSQNKVITIKDSITDRKIIYSLALGIGLFIVLHNWFFNFAGFLGHIKLITSGSPKIRPRFDNTFIEHLSMLWQSLIHVKFSLGLPIFIVCSLGLLKSWVQRRKLYLLWCLWIPAISYYLFFISVVLYNDVRYLLPSCIVLAFFGGKFIADFSNPAQRLFKLKSALISIVFIYTLLYASSVNVLMHHDSRYYVEKWMVSNIDKKAFIFGAGDVKFLPRLHEFNAEANKRPSVDLVEQIKPEYIIVSKPYDGRKFETGTKEREFFSKLENNELNYHLALKYKFQPKWDILNQEKLEYRDGLRMEIYGNFDKINPEIKIFKKQA